jgi:hypothetical protein
VSTTAHPATTTARRLFATLTRLVTLDRVALVLLVVSLIPIVFPFFEPGYPAGHDTGAHVTYTYRFDQAWQQGQIPVRWVEGTRPGDNQPLFNFYQVGFYYLVELVHLVVPRLSVAVKATVVLVWWMGAGFIFLLFRRCGFVAAVIAVVMFALSPYMIVDGFIRSAYPEMAAIAFVTGVLWSFERWLTTGRTWYLPIASVLVAMSLLCHLPAVLMTAPMCAAHVIGLIWTRQTTTRRVVGLAFTTLLGVGLAAFYVLPALRELDLIQIQGMTQHTMDFHENFVPPQQWFRFALGYRWTFGASVRDVNDLLPVHISAAHWIFIVSAVVVLVIQARRRSIDWRVAGLIQWLAVTALAMFMMTASSAAVWDAIPALSYVQFPWRFFMLLSVSGAALGALLMSLVPNRRWQAALLILIVGLQVHLYHRRLRPPFYVPMAEMNIDDPAWRDTYEASRYGFYETAYDPVGATRRPADHRGRWAIVEGRGTIEVQALTDASVSLTSSSDGPMTVRINSHFFPGWVALVDGRAVPITPTSPDGHMQIAVPPGQHQIQVALTNTPVRAAANTISLIALIVLAMMVMGVSVAAWPGRRLRRPLVKTDVSHLA